MFLKRKKADISHNTKIILGMIMLKDKNPLDIERFTKDVKNNFGENIQEHSADSASFVFRIEDEMVAIAHLPVPIPLNDIEQTALYAYNWQTALKDTKDHKSHLIV